MELFKIGGPNPDTNYLFMGASPVSDAAPHTDDTDSAQAITSTEATSP
jgi:hypothetical protein